MSTTQTRIVLLALLLAAAAALVALRPTADHRMTAFVNDSIVRGTWTTMGTQNGGEVVSVD